MMRQFEQNFDREFTYSNHAATQQINQKFEQVKLDVYKRQGYGNFRKPLRVSIMCDWDGSRLYYLSLIHILAKQGRIFAVIFLALLIPVLLKAPESEAKVYRGKCKSNLAWSYDSKTKTMVIDCKGDMPDDKQFYGLDVYKRQSMQRHRSSMKSVPMRNL